jgi:hypothetical protein
MTALQIPLMEVYWLWLLSSSPTKGIRFFITRVPTSWHIVAQWVPPLTIVNIDRLPDYLLNSGLEILSELAALSPTAAAVASTAFMASYLSPSSPGVGSSRRDDGVQVGSSRRGDNVHGGPFSLDSGDSGVPADPQGSYPPRRPCLPASAFIGGLVPCFRTPVRNPYVTPSQSIHTDPGGFCWEYQPPPVRAPHASGLSPARQPNPDEDLIVPPSYGRGSFSSSVSFGGFCPGSSVGGYHGGRSSSGGHYSSSSSGSHGGPTSSIPSVVRPSRSPTSGYDGSGDLSTVDDLSVSTSRVLIHGGSRPVHVLSPIEVSSSGGPLVPIPVPTDRFTLPPIKSAADYLQTRNVLLFWLCSPGFSTARSDELLLTDARNAFASQYWEGQLRAAIKDGPARFLYENMGTTFYGKGFEMLQVLEDHFRPSTISNSFTTLLSLFNDTQGDKESIHQCL